MREVVWRKGVCAIITDDGEVEPGIWIAGSYFITIDELEEVVKEIRRLGNKTEES